jgi:hypothetical protein
LVRPGCRRSARPCRSPGSSRPVLTTISSVVRHYDKTDADIGFSPEAAFRLLLSGCCSNLSHLGERLYRGDFAATLRAASHHAVGAPKGQTIRVSGIENLTPKP